MCVCGGQQTDTVHSMIVVVVVGAVVAWVPRAFIETKENEKERQKENENERERKKRIRKKYI